MKKRISLLMFLIIFVGGTFYVLTIRAQRNPNPDAGEWLSVAHMPTARSEIASAVLGGKIYVGGGIGGQNWSDWEALTTFEAYDPETDTWETRAPMPVGLHHSAMATADDKIYVTGGYDGEDFVADNDRLFAYDPEADTWEALSPMPGPRAAHAMVAIGDKLYVVGGVGPNPEQLWVYDIETDTWDTASAPLPTLREHLTAVNWDDKLVVIGGRWGNAGNLPTVELYDPETDNWTQLADMSLPRGGLTAAVLGDNIHVTGGESLSGGLTYWQHDVYDPQTDTWTLYPDLPTPRHGLTSASVDGKWYVIGGGEQAGSGTIGSLSAAVEVFINEE